jgi:predicted nucleic acid-binding protein
VRAFVDTNVLVYLFDSDAPAKQQRARGLVAELARSGALVVSAQVLSELYVTLTRKLTPPVPAVTALRIVRDVAVFPVVPIDAALVDRAARRAADEPVSFWDALILEAAIEAGADTVFSEDLQPGLSYDAVTVRDPFAADP